MLASKPIASKTSVALGRGFSLHSVFFLPRSIQGFSILPEPSPPTLTLSIFTQMALAGQTLDISGERQSGQDVRTQNGNRRPRIYVYERDFELSCKCFCIWFIHLLCEFAVMACQAVANIVKSSLGPVGLDKVCFAAPIFSL